MSDKYDGEVIINTRLDTNNLDKDVNSLNKSLKESDKQGKLNIASMAKLGAGVAALGVAVKSAVSKISELTDAYKTQERAEILLETAVKNNPYLNSSVSRELKNFASQMQLISGVSDDIIIQMEAQLLTSGRNQQEVMNIISTSLNVASTGAMGFDSAVRNLNKTFSGLAGELGETVPAIRNLTQEQLKNGEAVGVLAKQYEGMAKEVTDNIGTQQRLNNEIGDLKEELGSPFEKAMGPMRTFFANIISGWTESLKKKREYNEAKSDIEEGVGDTNDYTVVTDKLYEEYSRWGIIVANANKEIEEMKRLRDEALSYNTDIGNDFAIIQERNILSATNFLNEYKKSFEAAQEAYRSSRNELNILADQEKLDAEKAQLDLAESARLASIEERNKKAIDHINATRAALEKQLEVLRLTAEATGETVDRQEVLNAYVNGYVSLITESNGLVTENNQAAKDWLNELNAIAATLPKISEDQTKAIEELKKAREALNESIDSILNVEPEKESERMQLLLDKLDKEYEAVISRKELEATEKRRIDDEYLAAREKLSDDIKRVAEEEAAAEVQAKRQAAADMATIISDFANQYAQITSTIASLAKDNITTEAEVQKLEAQKQFEEGIISQEEYEKKKQEIDKKAAKETYRIQMWEWTASILTASANIAQGVTNAIATAGNIYAGIAMAALVGAAGAAQIATIIANKPIPPQFAQGGFVGGTSYTGDKVHAMVNSGEAILNSAQQREFMRLANGGNTGGGMKVEIHNSASNIVHSQPQMTERGMKIMIEQVVGDSIRSGRQNGNLRSADASQYGTAYTN